MIPPLKRYDSINVNTLHVCKMIFLKVSQLFVAFIHSFFVHHPSWYQTTTTLRYIIHLGIKHDQQSANQHFVGL